MTTCKDSGAHSFQTGSGSLQIERSGETARGQTATAPYIPRPCNARTHCREHSPHRISLRPPGTSWGRFHYAAAQDRIGRIPKTHLEEKTSAQNFRLSGELAAPLKFHAMPDR